MESQPTAVVGPLKLRIADDIRMRIERRELAPGDSLPTLEELCEQWRCSANPAREAIALLRQQGLITTGQGKPPVVRAPVRRVVRSPEHHQAEKDLVRASDAERQNVWVAKTDMEVTPDQSVFSATYDVIEAGSDLAGVFNVSLGTSLLRRVYEMSDPRSGRRWAWSVSYVPHALISTNPDLLDSKNEPWPAALNTSSTRWGSKLPAWSTSSRRRCRQPPRRRNGSLTLAYRFSVCDAYRLIRRIAWLRSPMPIFRPTEPSCAALHP